jgi:SWIM zinc finger
VAAGVEQVYRYPQPSTVGVVDGRVDVQLSTSGGSTAAGPALHPQFFDGFLGHPEQTATALLAVARVARTRFYVPPGMLTAILRAADPVVTSNGDRLRFESFSACCGVHARLDVLPAGMDGPALDTGTTNVDFNPPMRAALAGVGGIDPLHLAVGTAVTVTTMDAAVTEDKVPLPARWLKGFAEVQVATADAEPAFEVPAVEARRFLRGLPRSTGSRTATFWAVPAGSGLRLTSRPGPGAVCLAGPERLRVLEPMLRFARSLRAYSAPGESTSAAQPGIWELDLEDARMVVTLSPDVSRGFSGEGGILRDLADQAAADDADAVSVLLAFQPRIDIAAVARQTGISEARARRALGRLGAAGRVGYDAFERSYFHRELPYDPAALEALHPRLRDARALVDAGAVRIDGDVATVLSGGGEHALRRAEGGWRCSCPWYGKHQDSRGPCKHVLAVEMVAGATR